MRVFGSRRSGRAFLFVLALVVSAVSAGTSAALDVPPLRGRVNDLARLLDGNAAQALEERLRAYEQETGHQYVLLTLPSLEGEPLEDFTMRVVERWKLGARDRDDGLLLFVVPNDRRVRIEVGYGLEGAIPDALAGRIIRDVMTPRFRAGDYQGGIVSAFELLMRAGAGESVGLPTAPAARAPGGRAVIELFFLVLFLLFVFLGRGRRGMLILPGGFRGGGGFGGGGGFRGGGGGFGGGGASGSW